MLRRETDHIVLRPSLKTVRISMCTIKCTSEPFFRCTTGNGEIFRKTIAQQWQQRSRYGREELGGGYAQATLILSSTFVSDIYEFTMLQFFSYIRFTPTDSFYFQGQHILLFISSPRKILRTYFIKQVMLIRTCRQQLTSTSKALLLNSTLQSHCVFMWTEHAPSRRGILCN